MIVKFRALLVPTPKARARVTTRRVKGKVVAHAYTPKKTMDYELLVRTAALRAMLGRPVLTGPVFARINCVMPIPASWPKAKRQRALSGQLWPTSKPDLDNLKKAVFDAMNGVVYVDDSQVVGDAGWKRYGEQPRVEVTIRGFDQ